MTFTNKIIEQSEELHRLCLIHVMHRIFRLNRSQRNGIENRNATLKDMENWFQMEHPFSRLFISYRNKSSVHLMQSNSEFEFCSINSLICLSKSESRKYQSMYLMMYNLSNSLKLWTQRPWLFENKNSADNFD